MKQLGAYIWHSICYLQHRQQQSSSLPVLTLIMPLHIARLIDPNSIHSPVNRHAENASIHFQGVSEALDKPSLSLMLQIYHMFIKYCHQFKPTIMSYSRVSQVTMPFHQVYHIRYEVMPQISQGICFTVCVPKVQVVNHSLHSSCNWTVHGGRIKWLLPHMKKLELFISRIPCQWVLVFFISHVHTDNCPYEQQDHPPLVAITECQPNKFPIMWLYANYSSFINI